MKKLVVAAALALASLAPAVAQTGEKGCSMLGSWVSSWVDANGSPGPWTGIVAGLNSSGTITVENPLWPQDQNFSWVARVTLTGAWERTGSNKFAFTQVGFVPGPDGKPLFVAKNVGTETLTDDCNTLTVESTMQLFWYEPGKLTDLEPVQGFEVPLAVEPPMIAHRIVVERQ